MTRFSFSRFLGFFGPAAGSIKGVLIPAELGRALLGAAGASTLTGLVIAALAAVAANSTAIFPDTAVASLVAFTAAAVVDVLRRSQHGATGLAAAAALVEHVHFSRDDLNRDLGVRLIAGAHLPDIPEAEDESEPDDDPEPPGPSPAGPLRLLNPALGGQ